MEDLELENRKLMSIVLWCERRLPQHYRPYVQKMLDRPFEPDHTPIVQSLLPTPPEPL